MPLACHGGSALGWERRWLRWERRTVVRASCHVWRWHGCVRLVGMAAGYDEGSCPINTQFDHARPNPRQRAVRSGAASLGWLGYPTRGLKAANGLLTCLPAHWGAL